MFRNLVPDSLTCPQLLGAWVQNMFRNLVPYFWTCPQLVGTLVPDIFRRLVPYFLTCPQLVGAWVQDIFRRCVSDFWHDSQMDLDLNLSSLWFHWISNQSEGGINQVRRYLLSATNLHLRWSGMWSEAVQHCQKQAVQHYWQTWADWERNHASSRRLAEAHSISFEPAISANTCMTLSLQAYDLELTNFSLKYQLENHITTLSTLMARAQT